MSAAQITSSRSLSNILTETVREAEAVSRTATYDLAKRRIERIQNSQGIAANPTTGQDAPPPSVAATHAAGVHSGSGGGGGLGGFISGVGNTVVGGVEEVASAPAKLLGLAGGAAESLGQKAGEGILEWLEPYALKIALYGALIFGAIGMIVFGLLQLLKPIGVSAPSPRALAGKLQKDPELAAAA